MVRQLTGFIYITLSALGFGSMGTIAEYAFKEGVNVQTLLTYRFGIASLVLWLVIFIKRCNYRIKLNDILLLLVLGVLGYAVMSKLLYTSFHYVDTSIAILIFYCYPIIVFVLSVLLKKDTFTSTKFFSIIISVFGLLLIIQTTTNFNTKGILFSFVSSVIYALFIIISTSKLKSSNSLINSAYICFFTSLALLAFGIFDQQINFSLPIKGWGYIATLALISTVLPFYFFFNGLKILGATKTSIISFIEPVFAVFLSTMLLGENIKLVQFLGVILIVLGSIVLNFETINIEHKLKFLKIKKVGVK